MLVIKEWILSMEITMSTINVDSCYLNIMDAEYAF